MSSNNMTARYTLEFVSKQGRAIMSFEDDFEPEYQSYGRWTHPYKSHEDAVGLMEGWMQSDSSVNSIASAVQGLYDAFGEPKTITVESGSIEECETVADAKGALME